MTNIKDPVTEYARSVYKGDIVASWKVKKECERHLKYLNDSEDYYFDIKESNRVIKFLEMLPNPSTGELMELENFQRFIVGSIMGWKTKSGNRRFTKAYVSMSRKNGKSILISGLGLYDFLYGTNPKNERLITSSAQSREQASITWNMMKTQLEAIMEKSPKIKSRVKIIPSKNEIINLKDRSKIKPLSKEANNLDGYQISYSLLDEFHASSDTKVYDVVKSSQVLLDNPMNIIISTAGFNLNGPMKTEYDYLTKVLEGKEENDTYFTFIAEQDSEKEIYDESSYEKSNPLLANDKIRPTLMKNLKSDLNEAIQKQDINGTLVKNFNLWRQSSKETYIALQDWNKCITDEKIDIQGSTVYLSIDLSRSDDLTAIGMIFPLENNKFFVDSHVFVGTKNSIEEKSKRDKIDYMKLVQTDMATLTNTQSGIINYEQVCEWLIEYIDMNDLNVKGIMYDPWNAQAVISKLENETEYPLIEVTQNYKNLSPALKQFKLDVFEKKIQHNDNPNLNLAINNAITKTDNNGNIILDKMTNRNKIDALVALTTGYSIAMTHEFNNDLEDWILSDDFGF
ncbi:terminase large subunit [Staphylococcus gallinarum]|uniref:terminase large subunit n=2 Tax=Staphylococcus gallinarum TaxID=1293 RepID=UPI000D1F892F|nr:terminase TerL endonuclease subunit [Staphylococcus gallinarum]PTL18496.1 terminase large subunit [Staphylococcus gallinarum]RIL23775.1 terminase large subunit [Staphylococcus gallinarum]RIO80047.1 terminase large subunit [Staphylococcus gallinarum]RIO87708.1 terminase large subunit [Staphylococcus gallinarum]